VVTVLGDRRGQAFTLEGLAASIVVLSALLFAVQSTVVTPSSGGAVDASTRADLRQQADDVLVTAARAERNDLSTLVRNWSRQTRTFAGGYNPRIGYGPDPPPGPFGEMLNQTFTQRSHVYNVLVSYRGRNASDGSGTVPMVYRGEPAQGAVEAGYTITLYDNQTLTAPNASRNVELWQYGANATTAEDGYYPIPDAVDGPVYNVVEIRVIVW
jgi:hypothetical protein